jgi:uncharacterized Zn-finger protein
LQGILNHSLERHKLTHTGEKKFQCDSEGCGYTSARKDDLEWHKRTHTGEKRFKCDYEGCTYAAGEKVDAQTGISLYFTVNKAAKALLSLGDSGSRRKSSREEF